MKALLLAVILTVTAAHVSFAQRGEFSGLEQAMDAQTYERAGLRKLSASEREALDSFIREYVGAKTKDAATTAAAEAVDRAVKERKVRPPEVIESRFAGAFKGYGPRTVFHLENGQTWKPTNDEVANYSPIQNPAVVIVRDMFGYKMFIEGASVVRVKRVQ
jgi:hypothetical protein